MALYSDKVDDVATSSNFRDVKTINICFDWEVNFDEKKIVGFVKISMKSLKDNLATVTLDIHKTLSVSQINCDKESLPFTVEEFTGYGDSLTVKLQKNYQKDEQFDLEIHYVVGDGPSICWLNPQQTADKVKPYMYTQGQSVLNRSLFPCQDTPAVKATYSAFVKVPEGFTAVMSANRKSFGEKANRQDDKNCFYFELTIPIQSYLVALAVGDIKSARIGPRSHVWAEPSVLEAAKHEFDGQVENFIKTGEKLFGDYVWEIYDILIMPPSFPYGGMENPCLTFVTPCLIVGDSSLIDVVIHEITHSWFGNLATNSNWSEFWLNEGFTMFGQRRIHEALEGKASMCLEAVTGQNLLTRHIENSGLNHPLTRLRVIIEKGVDPDDTYNETPYEKGFSFVCYLESLVGDQEKFNEFLRAYIQKFKYQSIVAEDLFEFYLSYFPELKEQSIQNREGFDFIKSWLEATGHPPFKPDLSASQELTKPVDHQVQCIVDLLDQEKVDVTKWSTHQGMYFFDQLAAKSPLSDLSRKRLLSQDYAPLRESRNWELRQRWCEVIIKNDMQEHKEVVRSFLQGQGKQKYCKPTYELMVKASEDFRKFAHEVFEETKDFLHVNVRGYVKKILGLD